jgi:outer membrane receptor protein involved in Fe transport
MLMTAFRLTGLRVLSSATILTAALTMGSIARADEAADPQNGDIIVTGEKIGRTLKDTSTAVTVIRDVDPQEFRSPYDVASRVPNMVGTAADLPSIRGVTGSGAAGGIFTLMSGARPRIATIIDGIAETFGGQRYADAGMWDVDQVEVLRGPQSTTLGRNSLGGAIVIKTKDPTQTWEGGARAGFETRGDTGYLAGVISGPIVTDELAVRLAADGTRGKSYIKYDGGTGFPFDPAKIERTNLRGKILWTPSALPGFTALITGTKRWNNGEYLYSATGPDFFKYRFDNPFLNTRTSDSTVGTVSVDLGYDLGEGLSAHLIYGHGWYDATFLQSDQNNTDFRQGLLEITEQNNTAEARLVYAPTNSALSGVFGLYYYDRHQVIKSDLGVNGPDSVKTYAAYFDATIAVTDRLSLLLGGRVEREEQKRNVALSWGTVTADNGQTLFLPKVGVRYAVADSTNVSATVRKGYSPGGGAIDWDSGVYYFYDKEEVTTYEVGTRSELAGKALTVGTNFFFNEYKGYQGLIALAFTNIPKARSYGAEFEATYRPWYGMEVFGNFGLLNTRIKEAPTRYPTVAGRKLDNAPSFTGGLGFNQNLRSGFLFGGNVNRVGRYNSQVESGTAISGGDYTVVNAHIGYKTERFGVRAYVKNLGNEHILYSARTNQFGDIQGQVGQPRAFGITVDTRF